MIQKATMLLLWMLSVNVHSALKDGSYVCIATTGERFEVQLSTNLFGEPESAKINRFGKQGSGYYSSSPPREIFDLGESIFFAEIYWDSNDIETRAASSNWDLEIQKKSLSFTMRSGHFVEGANRQEIYGHCEEI